MSEVDNTSSKRAAKQGNINTNTERVLQLLQDAGVANDDIIVYPKGRYYYERERNETPDNVATEEGKKSRPGKSDILISEKDYEKLVSYINKLIDESKPPRAASKPPAQGMGGRG